MPKLIRTIALVAVALTVPPDAFSQTARDTGTVVNDAWITTQVYAKFFMDPDIKGRNISVDTMAGVVTLTGTVQSGAERNQAIAKAKTTEGVKQVVDKLSLATAEKPLPSTPPEKGSGSTNAEQVKAHAKSVADRVGKEVSDTWITSKVQAMYFLDRDVKGMNIDVTTKRGIVTLTGTVATEATRQKAIADARSIEGVNQVIDKLTIQNGKK
ncbi:MAG TPA: BON domain-containing protein [Vicinamibacterales bacterium]|jgi:hyperosmotically inducible periplasmic protein|nr:BON domain-containing protein [Vicinamibacterales bacterium]